MPEPSSKFPFAYRLPSDVAAQIHGADAAAPPLVTLGSPRRGIAVLVLVLGLLGVGFAAGLPTSAASAMRTPDCGPGWVVDAVGTVTADENFRC